MPPGAVRCTRGVRFVGRSAGVRRPGEVLGWSDIDAGGRA
ncbi:hypothetical protein BURMUCF1_1433 [Burkholderia multivorans ATCC BAA-247]|nr:hypothetical protein BURMUCF1_1433 [Burkholderia multivorans ATCC BAA-247]